MNLHAEKPGCSLPAPLCRPAYADSVPPCVLAKVLEKPDPGSLSSHLSEASAQRQSHYIYKRSCSSEAISYTYLRNNSKPSKSKKS